MPRTRIELKLAVDLDAIPGVFYTEENAREIIQRILMQQLPHYNPEVTSV